MSSPKSLSDEELAKHAPTDKTAFGELVSRYEKPLLRYLLRISDISLADAEDILQEVFLKTWRNIRDFDADLKFSSWIYRIAKNESVSAYRKRSVRPEGNREDDEELFLALPGKIDLQNEVNQYINAIHIRELLALLPPKYRDVLILRFLEDKSQEEVSDILRIPSNTVATLVFRAKQKFCETAKRQQILFSD